MGFCVFQGMTTLINWAYKNRGHAQLVVTNLKQTRMTRKMGNTTNRATTHT
jgi:hypothetical protein